MRNLSGLQLWDQWELPEVVERNEGDDESVESLQEEVSEPDHEMP